VCVCVCVCVCAFVYVCVGAAKFTARPFEKLLKKKHKKVARALLFSFFSCALASQSQRSRCFINLLAHGQRKRVWSGWESEGSG